jgi:hypothetical protein
MILLRAIVILPIYPAWTQDLNCKGEKLSFTLLGIKLQEGKVLDGSYYLFFSLYVFW